MPTDKQREAVAAEYNSNRSRLVRLRAQLAKAYASEKELKRQAKIVQKIDHIDRELNKVKMAPIAIAILIAQIIAWIISYLKKDPVA